MTFDNFYNLRYQPSSGGTKKAGFQAVRCIGFCYSKPYPGRNAFVDCNHTFSILLSFSRCPATSRRSNLLVNWCFWIFCRGFSTRDTAGGFCRPLLLGTGAFAGRAGPYLFVERATSSFSTRTLLHHNGTAFHGRPFRTRGLFRRHLLKSCTYIRHGVRAAEHAIGPVPFSEPPTIHRSAKPEHPYPLLMIVLGERSFCRQVFSAPNGCFSKALLSDIRSQVVLLIQDPSRAGRRARGAAFAYFCGFCLHNNF